MEKTAFKNRATTYCDALKGQWEDNVLSQVFFSSGNIQIIQNAIRAEIYKLSGNKYVVAPPGMDNLKIVMKSIFMSYAEFYNGDITKQVEELNKAVLAYCVPELFSAAKAHVNYLQDQSSLVVPLRLPNNHDREFKQLELKPWV